MFSMKKIGGGDCDRLKYIAMQNRKYEEKIEILF